MKKILYFMPDNPIEGKAGNLTRSKQMLDFFHKNSDRLKVDFMSITDWGVWSEESIEKFKSFFPNIHLYLFNRKISKKHPIKRILFYKIPNFFYKLFNGRSIDVAGYMIKHNAIKVINKNKYDIIIISYASWGKLIDGINYKPYLINDTHDFITGQSRRKKNSIGKLFQSEMNILRKYDEIWTYSSEEEYIFDQFTGKKVVLIPVSFPLQNLLTVEKKEYDILFVGSDNEHNVNGIHWFLDNVLHFLGNYNVHIIGRVCEKIKNNYPNVYKHGMVEDIASFYNNSRVAICPMFSGTGIKIKVLEALSYNLPVVTNRRGVDGLLNKKNNGCLVTEDAEQFSKFIIDLIENDKFYEETRMLVRNYFIENHNSELEQEILNKTFLRN